MKQIKIYVTAILLIFIFDACYIPKVAEKKENNVTPQAFLQSKDSATVARSEEHTSELQSPCKSRMPSSA